MVLRTSTPHDSTSLANPSEEGPPFSETGDPLAPSSRSLEHPCVAPGWDEAGLSTLPRPVVSTITSTRALSTRHAYALSGTSLSPGTLLAEKTPENARSVSYFPSCKMGWNEGCLPPQSAIAYKIQSGNKLVLSISTDACQGKDNFVRYLEHVQAVITVNASRRGDLNVNMTSPMGTKSILLSRRPRDDDAKVGFDKWPFMTTHTWGEDPRGTWLLEVGFQGETPQNGLLKEWTVMLHGTQSAPYIDQVVRDYQSKLAMSKKEELEEELDEAVERSLKSLLSKNN
ncbi:hypothetical protein PO909_019935 [Leuciscus waleckii]